jgi:hypothetical protein
MRNTSVCWLSCLLVLCAAAVTRGNLVAQWNFDEGSGAVAKDSSGNGHDGKLLGTPEWATGPADHGGAVSFYPGGCTGVDCGIFDPTNGKGQFTLALWAFWDGTGTFQHFLTKTNGWGATTMMFQFELWGAHTVAQYTDKVGISYDPDSTEFSVMPKNEWVHLAWSFDGKNCRLYLNGVDEVGPKPLKIGPNVAAPVLLGVDWDGQRVFHGMFDEVQIHDKALTADEIAQICPPSRVAKNVSPADGTVGVQVPLLQWKAGYKGVLHEVYLGTSPDLGPADMIQPRNPGLLCFPQQPLQPGVKYYWRVDEIEADTTTVNKGNVWSFVMEALTAYQPVPADGSTDVAPAPMLTWSPGQGAHGHHVYFGTDPNAVAQGTAATDKGPVADPNYAPGTLETLTKYFWRVDETVGINELVPGPVWSFTTCLPIDDFEAYNDEEGQGTRIYETWSDGYSDGSSGSTVGNLNPPFAEPNIVHSGLQSMPIDYNNVPTPYYSEAKRTWTKAQDWTTGDVAFLVLNLQGQATNQTAPIYVAVADNAGHTGTVVYADAFAFRATKWLEWKIPLSAFSDAGVKLTAVKTLYIGMGDRNATAPGGKGKLFIDDIRLIKP